MLEITTPLYDLFMDSAEVIEEIAHITSKLADAIEFKVGPAPERACVRACVRVRASVEGVNVYGGGGKRAGRLDSGSTSH